VTPEEAHTLVLAAHSLSIPVVVPVALKFADHSEWFQKSLAGTDALLLRLRQIMGESLRVRLASLPPAPATTGLVLDERGDPQATRVLAITQGEAFRDIVHDFVREHIVTLSSYSTVQAARDSWARWARRVSWAGLLLSAWQTAAAALVLCAKVLDWGWQTKTVMLTLVPTIVLVFGTFVSLLLTLRHHDRIMNARRAYDPL